MELIRGDDVQLDLSFINEDTNAPIDITSSTVFFTVKKKSDHGLDDDEALIKKEQTTHVNPTQGLTTIQLTSTDTNIEPGEYEYDFQVKDQYNNIQSTILGQLEIFKDVTRRTS